MPLTKKESMKTLSFHQSSLYFTFITPSQHNHLSQSLKPIIVNRLYAPCLPLFSNHLSVSNQTGLRSIVRVSVGTRKSQSRIPSISGTSIFRAQVSNHCLSSSSSTLGGGIGSTDVGQLIVNSVGDDAGVQSLLLTFVDQRVNGLEGRCGGSPTI